MRLDFSCTGCCDCAPAAYAPVTIISHHALYCIILPKKCIILTPTMLLQRASAKWQVSTYTSTALFIPASQLHGHGVVLSSFSCFATRTGRVRGWRILGVERVHTTFTSHSSRHGSDHSERRLRGVYNIIPCSVPSSLLPPRPGRACTHYGAAGVTVLRRPGHHLAGGELR